MGCGPDQDIAVAIVSYNTRELLAPCLRSVCAERPAELVVIDNASTDRSADLVRDGFPEATVLANRANHGYAVAVNEALRATRSRYVFVLNADTVVMPGSIRAARAYMDARPEVGLLGPRVCGRGGDTQQSFFPFPGTLDWLLENNPIGPALRRVPVARRRMLRYAKPTAPRAVPWVLGAAMVIRRAAFDAIGGFDEAYFMYYEEVDFSFRLHAAGWAVHFAPAVVVQHVGGASTSQRRIAMIVQHHTSTVRYYRRHYRGPRLHFWLNLMRIKMACRIARDALLAPVTRDAALRRKRSEQLAAWRIALFGRGAR